MQALRRALRVSVSSAPRWASTSASAAPAQTIFELRTYTLHPSGFKKFLQLSDQWAALRSKLNPGFRGMFVCDTGGVLNRVTHLYSYDSLEQRADVRRALAADAQWQHSYIDAAREFVAHQARALPGAACCTAARCAPASPLALASAQRHAA
jgi:hypothetical protein